MYKIVAAFRGMHVSPAKKSYASVTDGQTNRRTDDRQSDPYVSLCFAGDTKTKPYRDSIISDITVSTVLLMDTKLFEEINYRMLCCFAHFKCRFGKFENSVVCTCGESEVLQKWKLFSLKIATILLLSYSLQILI